MTAPLQTLRERRALANRVERERRLVEVLRALQLLGATGTPTVTARQVGSRLGHAISDKHARHSVAARLRVGRQRGLVHTSWDARVLSTRYALSDAGIDYLRKARRRFP